MPIPEEGLTWEEILQRAVERFNSLAGHAPTDSEINRWIAEQIEFFKKIHSSPETAINYWTVGLTTPFFEAMKHDISTKEYWINYGEAGVNLFTLGTGAVIKQGTKQGIDTVVTGVIKRTDEVTFVNPIEIRFSQSSVNRAKEITESMKINGWKGAPIDVVRMSDGNLTTVDNTRVLAAKNSGINVQAKVRNANDPIPSDMAQRFVSRNGYIPKTWGEAVTNRINNQNSSYRTTYPNGSYVTGWDGR